MSKHLVRLTTLPMESLCKLPSGTNPEQGLCGFAVEEVNPAGLNVAPTGISVRPGEVPQHPNTHALYVFVRCSGIARRLHVRM